MKEGISLATNRTVSIFTGLQKSLSWWITPIFSVVWKISKVVISNYLFFQVGKYDLEEIDNDRWI